MLMNSQRVRSSELSYLRYNLRCNYNNTSMYWVIQMIARALLRDKSWQ